MKRNKTRDEREVHPVKINGGNGKQMQGRAQAGQHKSQSRDVGNKRRKKGMEVGQGSGWERAQ